MIEYPLLPLPAFEPGEPPTSQGFPPGRPYPVLSTERQRCRLGPKFDRLRSVLESDRGGLSLRDDPSSIAPERALVLEVTGSIGDFYSIVRRVEGLEFLGDEEVEFEPDDDFFLIDTRVGREGHPRTDKPVGGRLYLAMPDVRALRELLGLWNRWQRGKDLPPGRTPWRDLFASLRDIRPWGPADRLTDTTIERWFEELETDPKAVCRIEAELWFRGTTALRDSPYQRLELAVSNAAGKIIDHAVIDDIGYEAALIDLPSTEIKRLIAREEIHLAICDEVMYLRPQSSVDIPQPSDEIGPGPDPPVELPAELPAVVALLDGFPVQNHQLLRGRIDVDDADDLEPMSVVSDRYHGTAMASLILHGDRNRPEPSIQRRLHIRPVLYAPGNGIREEPRRDRLFVDTIYRAVRRMKEGDMSGGPTAPEVFLINLSVCDLNRPFSGPMSPFAKLLDHLAERYGILFLVSAGNIVLPLPIDEFPDWTSLENASPEERERAVLSALAEHKWERTLLSPAEAMNVVTVGALHYDSVVTSRGALVVDPYANADLPNISSALGLGHRKVIKPDIHLPGGREHIRFQGSGQSLIVVPGGRSGLSTASPDPDGRLDSIHLTPGTSAAAALATRAAHRIFEALMDRSGGSMLTKMDPQFYAVVIKALLVHRSSWGNRAQVLDQLYGPHGQGQHVARSDNIARLLGYGFPDVEEAIACAPNRATLVGYGTIKAREANIHRIPLPPSLEMVTEPRAITVTVAWFSPINRFHQAYRRAKLEVTAMNKFPNAAGVTRASLQPSYYSVLRGTLFHTRYEGEDAVPFIDGGYVLLRVMCKEQAGSLDQSINYGVAVTIEAGEGIRVYLEVRDRLAVRVRPRVP